MPLYEYLCDPCEEKFEVIRQHAPLAVAMGTGCSLSLHLSA
jgi:predicted nucleic acid-binding Zn ribbon protein